MVRCDFCLCSQERQKGLQNELNEALHWVGLATAEVGAPIVNHEDLDANRVFENVVVIECMRRRHERTE